MESFVKIVNGLKETRISSKNSIIDVLQGFFWDMVFFGQAKWDQYYRQIREN